MEETVKTGAQYGPLCNWGRKYMGESDMWMKDEKPTQDGEKRELVSKMWKKGRRRKNMRKTKSKSDELPKTVIICKQFSDDKGLRHLLFEK